MIYADNKTGFLSDVGNVDEMAENVLKLLNDRKMFNEFKTNAFEQAKRFDIDKILPQYEKIYTQLISK